MKDEDELAALRPSPGVKLAAAVMGATGFMTLLVCMQTYSVLRMRGIVTVVVPVSFVLGASLIFFAIQLARLRGWGSSLLAFGKAQRADAVRTRLEAGGIDPGF